MALELGFFFTIAVAGWLCLGALFGRSSGRGSHALAVLGLIGACWAIGELLLLRAVSQPELVTARRVFHLGAAGLPPVWLWVSLRAYGPRWFARRPAAITAAFLVPFFFYSFLYWDGGARFIDWQSPGSPHTHGPYFELYVAHQHLLAALGTYYFVRTAMRLRRTSLPVMTALIAGVAIPLMVNAGFVLGFIESDWTAAALGPAGILIWLAIVDSGLVSNLPIDRNELIEQLDVGVVVADLDSRIVSVNAAARRLTELDRMRGRPLAEAVAAAEQRPDAVVETRGIALRGRLGVVGHALILTDRTEAETSRRRLELAGRLEALGSLTAGIAHEVNNPLAYVQANLSSLAVTAKLLADPALQDRLPGDLRESVSDMEAIVEETREGLERIQLLVQRLKTFTRAPEPSARALEIDLLETVEQAASVASVGLGEGTIRIQASGDHHIATLETAVFQILVNLLLNAVQASTPPAKVVVRLHPQGDGIAIDVIDEGPGITESVLPRIFDPFFTTKPTGTGLGLSLSYDLAQQIGGRLEAVNREARGAIFTLWLPTASPLPSTPEEAHAVSS
jgi:signal transduction histidine kinase